MRALCLALLLALASSAVAAASAPTAGGDELARALEREAVANEQVRDLRRVVLVLGIATVVMMALFMLRQMSDARRLREMAMIDELTRLPNRRHLLSSAGQLVQHVQDTDQPLSLLTIDVDRFKRVNEQHGHAVADQALQRVAHACRMTLRPTDLIGRTGGAEFTVLLPGTAQVEARRAAERVRVAVEALALADLAPGLALTLSIGVATWRETDSLGSLMARGDERLRQAKATGRNRVVPAAG